MNSESRQDKMNAHFSTQENADIFSSWNPHYFSDLKIDGSQSVKFGQNDQGFAVQLGQYGNPQSPWVEVNAPSERTSYVYDHGEASSNAVELNIINPKNISLGRSALEATVLLLPGDSFSVGKFKYPGFDEYTSRMHANFTLFGSSYDREYTMHVADNQSTSGTLLFNTLNHQPDTEYEEAFFSDDSNPWYDVFKEKQESKNNNPLLEFIAIHTEAFPSLSEADFTLCFAVCTDLKAKYPNANEKRVMEREFNRHMHPDRHSANPVAHAIYILGKQVLGL